MMTEAEWLKCADPQPMLRRLRHRLSDRKCRLFIVACCRRVSSYLVDERSRHAIEVGERYADGTATETDRELSQNQAQHAAAPFFANGGFSAGESQLDYCLAFAALTSANCVGHSQALFDMASSAAKDIAVEVIGEGYWPTLKSGGNVPVRIDTTVIEAAAENVKSEKEVQCNLLRDILGNPFLPVTLDPAWLRWNDGLIRQAAQRIYDDRAFDDLPILGDALEDAGCREADILEHCRRPGEHVRGCWVVDLLLGKE